MKKKIYQVSTNLVSLIIQEIECVKITDSSYWTDEKTRHTLDTDCYKSFDTKKDAVRYLKSLIEHQIRMLENSIEHYNKKLDEFHSMYGK